MKFLEHRSILFARKRHPVLILGESGTGKTWLARKLHEVSPFHAGPLVAVSAPQLEVLGQSTLIGHSDNAYTGARRAIPGAIERAMNGTLFVDEIGLASPSLQELLLTLTDASEITRLGDTRSIPVRTRLIVATNEPLELRRRKQTFRDDLYWRLATFRLYLPPLRERPKDIPYFAQYFLEAEAGEEGVPVPTLSAEAHECLARNPWPGNLRELKGVIIRTLAVTPGQPVIEADDLDFDESDELGRPVRPEITPRRMRRALDRNGGNRTRAAEELGYSVRQTQRIVSLHPGRKA